jgi:hypothetical protein
MKSIIFPFERLLRQKIFSPFFYSPNGIPPPPPPAGPNGIPPPP